MSSSTSERLIPAGDVDVVVEELLTRRNLGLARGNGLVEGLELALDAVTGVGEHVGPPGTDVGVV